MLMLMLTYANLETGSNNIVALQGKLKTCIVVITIIIKEMPGEKNYQILIDETLKCKNSAKSCKIIGVNTKKCLDGGMMAVVLL